MAKKSVKIVPGKSSAMDNAQRISANHAATNKAAERKSGALAKTTASRVNTNPTGKVSVIQINSAKGTQAGHTVTTSKNHTKPVSRGRGGGLSGGFAGGNMEFPEQIK